jgi:hypothetical protein
MVSLSVKIDPKSLEEFQKALNDFTTQLGKDFQDEAIHQGHLLCVDAMRFTPPMDRSGGKGLSKSAEKWGQYAVKGDINSLAISANKRSAAFLMYRKLGDATFRNDQSSFYRVLNNSKKSVSNLKNTIMIKIAQDPNHERAFKKARNLFGKTTMQTTTDGLYDKIYDDIAPIHRKALSKYNNRSIRKKTGSGMTWINKAVTSDQSVIDKEYKHNILSIGRLKAGWYKAKLALPKYKGKQIKDSGDRIPAWIIRHTAQTGICNFTLNDKNVSLKVINTIGNNNNVATDANTKSIVYGERVKMMNLNLEKALAAGARKFNKQ